MKNHKTTFSSPILLNKYLFLKDELNQENLGVRTQICVCWKYRNDPD